MTDEDLIERMIEDDEGGWVFTDYDLPTYAGCTLASFREVYPSASVESLKRATKSEILTVYRARFLDRLDGVPRHLHPAALSACVNLGMRGGAIVLQTAANSVSPFDEWIAVDGILGGRTHGALSALTERHGEAAVQTAFVLAWIERYQRICTSSITKRRYLKGWVARALRHLPRGG